LHNEELHNLYASPNIIRVIKSRIRWAGHVARIGKMRIAYDILVANLKGRDYLEDLGRDMKTLDWIIRKELGGFWLDSSRSG
jgi:hypothetical protein